MITKDDLTDERLEKVIDAANVKDLVDVLMDSPNGLKLLFTASLNAVENPVRCFAVISLIMQMGYEIGFEHGKQVGELEKMVK